MYIYLFIIYIYGIYEYIPTNINKFHDLQRGNVNENIMKCLPYQVNVSVVPR